MQEQKFKNQMKFSFNYTVKRTNRINVETDPRKNKKQTHQTF